MIDEVVELDFIFVPDGAAEPVEWLLRHGDVIVLRAVWVPGMGGAAVQEPRGSDVTGAALVPVQGWLPPLLFSRPPGFLPRLMERIPGQGGKEAASNVPSWARGMHRRVGEKPIEYARRLMNEKYGPDGWDPSKIGPTTEFNRIKKFGERAFQDPVALPWLNIGERPSS